jgi:hypothetical protein
MPPSDPPWNHVETGDRLIWLESIDYIVVRLPPDLPEPARECLASLDGRWFDRQEPPWPPPDPDRDRTGEWVASATGRVEFREDGAAAEVYEIRP